MTQQSEIMPTAALWDQVWMLTWANLKSRYRKTIAGFLWVILSPIVMYTVQFQVFSRILKIQMSNYNLFLLSGLLPWIFVSQSLDMGTPLFLNYTPLLRAFPTNPFVYLSAQILDNFINFLAAFIIILVPFAIVTHTYRLSFLLLPLPLVLLVIGVMGLVWFLATLQVFLRDTRYLISFGLSIAFFLTPIFYPAEYVPGRMRWMISFNPFYNFIAPFQQCIYDFNGRDFLIALGHSAVVAALCAGLGAAFWKRKKSELYFYL